MKQSSPVQLSLFPCHGTGVKDNQNGSVIAAKYPTVSAYLKTPEALFRLIATYPPKMPLTEALTLARIDFTRAGDRALHACRSALPLSSSEATERTNGTQERRWQYVSSC